MSDFEPVEPVTGSTNYTYETEIEKPISNFHKESKI